jgi:hypothetical protein
MIWERSGECFYGAAYDAAGRVVWHLVVERLLDEGWDWTIWRPGDLRGTAERGTTKTIHEAMWKAEQATLTE